MDDKLTNTIAGDAKANEEKDWWDKAEVILKATGVFLTAVAAVIVGYWGPEYLSRKQAEETNVRLYAELMSRREESDSSMRKDMFDSVIQSFIRPLKPRSPEQAVLNLELLASNFHESLDLAPLFKQVYGEIFKRPPSADRGQLLDRLAKVKDEVMEKQLETLTAFGRKCDGTLDFDEIAADPVIIDAKPEEDAAGSGGISELRRKQVHLEVIRVEKERREVLVRLIIGAPPHLEVDKTFWIGPYDFPMLNNVRLDGGNRCAVVLRNVQQESTEITLVLFPGSRASLKEKPYYDEVMRDLLREQERLKQGK